MWLLGFCADVEYTHFLKKILLFYHLLLDLWDESKISASVVRLKGDNLYGNNDDSEAQVDVWKTTNMTKSYAVGSYSKNHSSHPGNVGEPSVLS